MDSRRKRARDKGKYNTEDPILGGKIICERPIPSFEDLIQVVKELAMLSCYADYGDYLARFEASFT